MISVAILDTGIASVADFTQPQNRIVGFVDFINKRNLPYDDNGHGSHIAGIVGGNGLMSGGRYVGVNPNAGLVGVKVLDSEGHGNSSDALAGIQWVLDNKERYGIRVVNLSIGTEDTGSHDPLVRAVEAAWDAGVVMVIAAGNNGPGQGSITSPGISRKVITVGAYDDGNCTDSMDVGMVNFSGRGPTIECIIKPDVLAAGCGVVSVLSNSAEMSPKRLKELSKVGDNYVKMSGTSMASPYVAGAISLLLTKNPQMTPDEVKLAIKRSSEDMFLPPNRQGWGKIDVNALLRI